MTVQSRVNAISLKVKRLRERELREPRRLKRKTLGLSRWVWLLYHEFLRDDVRIHAESLAFLMIFSSMPLVAGLFFVFSIFAQFGMVQDTIAELTQRFLETIPEAHRGFISDYVIQFKDAYLANLADKSGSIGIFALFILAWVGLQAFNNVDRTLNRIWGADRERPFLEKVRNFLVVSVAAPLVLLSALSLPHVVMKLQTSREIVQQVPMLLSLFNSFIVPALVLATFACLYRFVPVRRVKWTSALGGALFATVGLELSNMLMGFYFRFGTNSAYGKAAVIPLLAFWIYVIWVIVIMGAEFSYLLQNQKDILHGHDREPSFREGQSLILVLQTMLEAHRSGRVPVSSDSLRDVSGLSSAALRSMTKYLKDQKLLVECLPTPASEADFALGRDIAGTRVADLLRDYVAAGWRIDGSPADAVFSRAFEAWLDSFAGLTMSDLVAAPPEDGPARKKRPTKSATT